MNKLLDTQTLQNELSKLASQAKTEITIVSAYVTDTAINWILNKIPKNVKLCVIAKLSPQDFASKASTFEAIEMLLNAGHTVKLLTNLHAKIYLIDKEHIFIGSANFTSNGLKLFGSGNLEASIKTIVTPEILQFVDNIYDKSTEITLDILKKMREKVKAGKLEKIPLKWSNDIIKPVFQLWTIDMLQEEIFNENVTNEADKILLFGSADVNNNFDTKTYFKKTKIYQWLINELKQQNRPVSFGAISAKLHNDINDNPLPYRKTVKQYIKNLLSYCKLFAFDEIEITRPNYSEIMKLISK
jgi:phosphatidylserine/phosphatidylglycerophosphate/cardiolipin synthase-like enzyme